MICLQASLTPYISISMFVDIYPNYLAENNSKLRKTSIQHLKQTGKPQKSRGYDFVYCVKPQFVALSDRPFIFNGYKPWNSGSQKAKKTSQIAACCSAVINLPRGRQDHGHGWIRPGHETTRGGQVGHV